MTSAGFEPAIPATKRPQTYALELAATGIDIITNRAVAILRVNICSHNEPEEVDMVGRD
jgi:hypothetical protein